MPKAAHRTTTLPLRRRRRAAAPAIAAGPEFVEFPEPHPDMESVAASAVAFGSGIRLPTRTILYFNAEPDPEFRADGHTCLVQPTDSGERRVVVLTSLPDGTYQEHGEHEDGTAAPREGVRYRAIWPIALMRMC